MNKIFYNGSQWMAFYDSTYRAPGKGVPGAKKWNQEREQYLKDKAAALPVLNPEIIKGMGTVAVSTQGKTVHPVEGKEYDWPGTMGLKYRDEFIRDVGCIGTMPYGYILSLPSSAPEPKEKKTDNELIAEFMECSKPPNRDFDYFWRGEFFKVYNAKWDTSWDWLMPVVEKINSLNYTVHIYPTRARFYKNHTEFIESIHPGYSLINVVYMGIVEFIKWHNQQTQ